METRARTQIMAAACAALATSLGGAGSAAAQMLVITAEGTIGSSCTLAPAQNFGTPDLTASNSIAAQATVNCNTGFKVTALSTNGAILTTKPAPTGFTNYLPYNLSLSVPLDDASTASTTCASSALVAGQAGCALSPASATGLSSGGKTSIGKTATLTLAWTLSGPRLVAGAYADTITLSIATVQ